MSTKPDRLDDAYEAIRAHLHERPYTDDPSRIYSDLGSLSQLLAALEHVARNIFDAAEQAIGSDDHQTRDHRDGVRWDIDDARGELASARETVDKAHSHAGHLIFKVASRAGE